MAPPLGASSSTEPSRAGLLILLGSFAVAIFLGAGILMLPLLGLQRDEVMFVTDLQDPKQAIASFEVGRHLVPVMIMSYAGALKAWIYAPLLALAPVNEWSIRLPALFLSAITILLIGQLLKQIQGRIAAVVGICLLATDVSYLLTGVFDWGPVVIQNFLSVVALLAIVKWYQTRREGLLLLAGFIIGLDLWNKALFLWNLSGFIIATLLVALPQVIRLFNLRRVAVLSLGFMAGALPLLWYNLNRGGATLTQNSHFTLAEVGPKAVYLREALNGETAVLLFVNESLRGTDQIRRPLEALSLKLASGVGGLSSWRFSVGLALIVLGITLAKSVERKWILFFLISGLVGWFESAVTIGTGFSTHYTVLFWMNFYCAAVLAGAATARFRARFTKPALAVVAVVLCARGMLGLNLAYADLIAYDSTTAWTNADRALSTHLHQAGIHYAIGTDWGIAQILSLRSENKISAFDESLNLASGNFDRGLFENCAEASCAVVSHLPQRSINPKVNNILDGYLRTAHLAKTQETAISDSHGFPVFLVTRLRNEAPEAELEIPTALKADPAAMVNLDGLGRTTLAWDVPRTMTVEVRVDAPDGALLAHETGPSKATTGNWVKNGMQFFLQDVTAGKPLIAANTVAKVRVRVRRF